MEVPHPPPPCPRFPVANVVISRSVWLFSWFPTSKKDEAKQFLERLYFPPRFLYRDRFSKACKERDVGCDWQDLSSVKFNRDPGLVVNFSKQTHTHHLLKVLLLHDLYGRLHMRRVLVWFLPSIKVLFKTLTHNLRKREATSKFKNPLVLKYISKLEGRHVVPTKFVLRLKQVEEEVRSHRRYK